MAGTAYGVNHPLAVKVWAKKLFQEALAETYVKRFMGAGTGSLCQVKGELNKSAGDKITYGLRMQLTGDGVPGDETLEGNEEALATYSDSVLINQLRHAVRSGGKMSEQRVPFSVREEAREGLTDWWANRLDTWFFNVLGGNTVVGDTKFTGMNTATAPTTKIVVTGWNGTDETSLSTTSLMSLSAIDYAVEKAKTMAPLMRPIRVNGKPMFVCFLHPYQVTDLRTSTSTGQWLDIQKAALSGGKEADNPIFTGALGVYNGVVLHESNRVPYAITSAGAYNTNGRRAIFAGAQACVFANGPQGGTEMDWTEELFDFKNQLGVAAGLIGGMKKTVFNSADFATIVIPTYAVAHGA